MASSREGCVVGDNQHDEGTVTSCCGHNASGDVERLLVDSLHLGISGSNSQSELPVTIVILT